MKITYLQLTKHLRKKNNRNYEEVEKKSLNGIADRFLVKGLTILEISDAREMHPENLTRTQMHKSNTQG